MIEDRKVKIVSVAEYEHEAKKILPKSQLSYYFNGAGNELTASLNREAFDRIRIRPRCLRDVSNRKTNSNILGKKVCIPIGASPTALHRVLHPDGEIGVAKAARDIGTVYVMSSFSSTSMEEVAAAVPDGRKWLQLYIFEDRSLTVNLIELAEKFGFEALVLTVDSPRGGLRRSRMRDIFKKPDEIKFGNFPEKYQTLKPAKAMGKMSYPTVPIGFAADITWTDITWLMKHTSLPVILKGVLTKEDALLALQHGVAGIIVSNHGGRQLDSVPATIEALPEIVEAVGDRLLVMFDSGITQGTDVFKALALGAKMVFVGKPVIWGLAINGYKGVENVFDILSKEFEVAMDLAGCAEISDISREMVVHENYYSNIISKL